MRNVARQGGAAASHHYDYVLVSLKSDVTGMSRSELSLPLRYHFKDRRLEIIAPRLSSMNAIHYHPTASQICQNCTAGSLDVDCIV